MGAAATLAVVLGYLLGGKGTAESTVWPLRGSTQVDEVHLSWVGDPRTTVAIAWRSTPWAGNGALVEIDHRWRELPAHATSPRPVGPDVYEDVQVTGLRPGTRYPYAIRSRAGTVSEGVLTTAPARPAPFRFDAFADQGDCTHNHAACRVIAGIAADHPSFVLGAGDLSYANEHGPGIWDQWLDQVQAYTRTAPLMPTVGNHEFPAGDPTGVYPDPIADFKGHFVLPPTAHEDYYSFTYAGVHVVALPETYVPMGPGTPFQRWLEADLTAADHDPLVRWTVAFDHRPFYSSGQRHGPYEQFVHDELPTLDKHHVDLVLSGHEHNYERTLPLRGGTVVSRDRAHVQKGQGTVFVLTGGGGAGTYDDFGPMPAWEAVRGVHHEHLRIDVTPTALHVLTITDFGKTIDDFTITAQ